MHVNVIVLASARPFGTMVRYHDCNDAYTKRKKQLGKVPPSGAYVLHGLRRPWKVWCEMDNDALKLKGGWLRVGVQGMPACMGASCGSHQQCSA